MSGDLFDHYWSGMGLSKKPEKVFASPWFSPSVRSLKHLRILPWTNPYLPWSKVGFFPKDVVIQTLLGINPMIGNPLHDGGWNHSPSHIVADIMIYPGYFHDFPIDFPHFLIFGGNVAEAAHILGTLLQAEQQQQIPGVQHSKDAKVVYMAGHAAWSWLHLGYEDM